MALVQRARNWAFIRNGWVTGLFWSTIWLAYLAIPAAEIWTGNIGLAQKVLLTALLVGFVVCYVGYWAFSIVGRLCGRPRLYVSAIILALAVLGAVVGSRFGLGYTMAYAAAALALALIPRMRAAALSVFGLAALSALLSVMTRTDWFDTVLAAMITLSSGGSVLGFMALHIQNQELRAAREEIARLAVAEERLRFSRDLHDLLGHSLSVIVLKAELAHRMAERSPERTAQELGDIETVAREALGEVRDAVTGYRQQSLSQELETVAQTLHMAGIQVQVVGGAGALPGPLDAALAWTVREATTNVIRHARARRVRFDFARQDHLVRLQVVNDGVPPAAATPGAGTGLRGLQERLRSLGGDLRYGPGHVDGFTLTATLPLAAEGAPATPVVA